MKEEHKLIEYDLNRRQFLGLAGALTGTSALAGCMDSTPEGSNDGSSDKKIRLNVALAYEVWNFDPALWTDTSSSTVGSLIYDEVVGLTTDEKLKPGLVETVPKPTNGGKAYEYTLRKGLTFHNGDPVTAEDFKYSVDWILNPENNSPIQSRIPLAESTEITGDRTLRINLSEPFGTFNSWITRGIEGIVPKGSRGKTRKAKGPSGLATKLTKDPSGAGTGLFKFVEWKSGSHVLLKKNKEYWMDDVSNVDEIRFEFVTENATRLANLQSGNTDLVGLVPPKDYKSLKNKPKTTAQSIPGNTTEILYVNLMDTEGNPMGNVHNRRAVLFGIDAQEILDEIFYGQGVVQKGPWYPDSEWTSPKLKKMKLYDPKKARKELELAGNPDGFDMEILATKGSWFKDEAVSIQNQLAQIGINVTVTPAEKATVFNQVYSTTDWHAAMEDWSQSIPVALYWLDAGFADNNHNHNSWHHPSPDLKKPYKPSGPPAPKGVRDQYANGHEWFVDQLRKAQSLADKQKQKEIAWTLEEYIVENAIQIDIAYINKIQAWNKNVNDYRMGTFVDEYRFIEGGN